MVVLGNGIRRVFEAGGDKVFLGDGETDEVLLFSELIPKVVHLARHLRDQSYV